MEELEYITKDALMMCDEGGAPNYFSPTFNNKVKIHGCQVATNMDGLPAANIPSFKVCKITGGACNPVTMPMTWQDTWQVKVNHVHTLIGKSTCKCMIGGTIEFMTSGQVPLPDDAATEVQILQDQAQKELDDSGNGDSVGEAGFFEGMIPIWGSGRDMINAIQTGDTFGAVLNAGFLVWDVASIVAGALSFGAGTAIMQGAKVGMKAGIKAGTKVAGRVIKKKALEQLGKAGFKTLSREALKKSIDDVAKKLLRTCVFACFPEGTPVHTEFGLKNIEDVEVGDLVWAYDEETETISLQPVIDIMVNESDHTVSVYTDKEVIETTAIHPFYVEDTGWVDASELEEGHKVLTKDNEPLTINKVEFNYEPKKVYNFTVGNFHTYFVGRTALLVHNAKRCLTKAAKEAAEKVAKTWDDLLKYKHCFPAGTLVRIDESRGYAPIETLEIGDCVLAFDLASRTEVLRPIIEVYISHTESLYQLHLENEVIECTSSHRFWSETHLDWIEVKDLKSGDLLLNAKGEIIAIQRISKISGDFITYNLEVEEVHNYFVSSLDILVHNGVKFENSIFNILKKKQTEIYGIVDKTTDQIVYVGKSFQDEGIRFAQHMKEKGLDPTRYTSKTLDAGKWNAFQTAAREQHFIMKHGTKVLKAGAEFRNKINALGKAKFNFFSKLIKCP
ncbi:polymorphic toxin-type HINT domain-containing protein [Myroides profundi]|uniref:Intein C-terminal splicing region n=1 Tax=Myroides profundi TaxID=480520 RepID=A0AAJ5BDR9_MYRPR|nr:polymorphic toxin-type HINT domain-containing protein [Myroides profundi]AJH15846.1 pretoxin HINT domain protein [Myroides profundi]SEQ73385.1 intein C-terminal splicing region [Myroides profundi]